MSIHRVLQLNTAALAVMGAIFLGLGHTSSTLPLMLAVAAVAGVFLGEFFPWLRLNRIVANVIALGAVAWSLKDFLSSAASDQLLAIANMLVYLQIVLLFQEKSARVYWQLVVLSLLQVVVAAALGLGFYFAVLLAVYLLLALSALVLLCIYREVQPPPAAKVRQGAQATAGQSIWHALLAPPEVAPPGLSDVEVSRAFKASAVMRLVGGLAGATLVFTAVFFYATPRLSEGAWTGQRRKGASVSGIAENMRIEEQGRIHLSNQLVMRVTISNLEEGKPVALIGDPYFHGFVLSRYATDEQGSRWTVERPSGGFHRTPWPPVRNRDIVRQEVVMEQADPPVIYAMMPYYQLGQREVFYDRAAHRMRRREDQDSQGATEFRYTVGTLSVVGGRQLPGLPNPNSLRGFSDAEFLDAELAILRQFDAERFRGLAAVAEEVLKSEQLEEGTDLEKALALERHFHAVDRYRYSLNLDFQRDYRLDPIEDFVVNHRTGHCEYFASALALMLRSQDIPSRIVMGYKGGDYNPLGRYYAVQQKHAHAWVEAWMPPGMVDRSELAGLPSPGGTWYRLDPTPIAREGLGAAEEETLVRRIEQAFDYFDLMWRDYVLGLTADRQQGVVYDPLTDQASGLNWFETRQGRRWLRNWSRRLRLDGVLERNGLGGSRSAASGIALLVVFVAVLLLGLIKLSLFLGRLIRRRRRRASAGEMHDRRVPAFYLRLEKLLSRLPLRRTRGQTPRELAAAAQRRLSNGAARIDVAHVPGQVVEAYYRVRFGGDRLDKNETEQIEQALASLVPAVSQAQKQ